MLVGGFVYRPAVRRRKPIPGIGLSVKKCVELAFGLPNTPDIFSPAPGGVLGWWRSRSAWSGARATGRLARRRPPRGAARAARPVASCRRRPRSPPGPPRPARGPREPRGAARAPIAAHSSRRPIARRRASSSSAVSRESKGSSSTNADRSPLSGHAAGFCGGFTPTPPRADRSAVVRRPSASAPDSAPLPEPHTSQLFMEQSLTIFLSNPVGDTFILAACVGADRC